MTFLACQRRFQLRYVRQMPWPQKPLSATIAKAFEQGEIFHRLLEQHFRGLPVELPADADADVAGWWRTFERSASEIPMGEYHPEMTLTVPVGGHFLFGRFDLLILTPDHAYIYDWKTERNPRPAAVLRDDWQTKLYLAMVTEGASAVGRSYAPEQVSITYWFAREPEKSVTLGYTKAQHSEVWAELEALAERLDRRMVAPDAVWPLTDDWDECGRCGYRAYCDRMGAKPVELNEEELALEWEDIPDISNMEPTLPESA